MPDSPLSASPYEVLGVAATASHDELRKAYRKQLRATHPDSGGNVEQFHRVQRAWELIGTPEAREEFDRAGEPVIGGQSWAPGGPPPRQDTRPQTRQHGHPGGWFREQYLAELREWVGRGVTIADPYDAALLRRAPHTVKHLLASAIAEEDTARVLSTLGIGFTVWHDVSTGVGGGPPSRIGVGHPGGTPMSQVEKLDHIVLGPTGLWGILSEDWGEPVKVKRGELIGPGLQPGEQPLKALGARARFFARAAKVKFSGLVIVVPEGAAPADVVPLGMVKGAHALLVQRPRVVQLLRTGIAGIGTGGTDLFEVRSRVQATARFV
ncbi:MAG: molecular chaperone DnaJ [Leifsonia sp.]|nr:molecular chaperone DnaJ [Leifsonia sp.]|tara:strand:+ start:130795 stop:131763 length:969 start_codon:yes stop_codon:yes gene_type:complete